jgi:hypothetical protein
MSEELRKRKRKLEKQCNSERAECLRSQFKDRPEGCGVSQREGNGKGESCGSRETGIPQEKLCKHI